MATLSPPRAPRPAPYPVHVDADPAPVLSRWLWLVKWLLVIPHAIVLAFLWIAFSVLSAVALVMIVVTGRYPHGIFQFNVGVLRWTWRVTYYSYGALATDRYPPFTLDDVPDYPAHLDVEYPAHLSRGLVLVKWWLLALPHYLVVAVFLGTGWETVRVLSDGVVTEGWAWRGGLIGLLALIAAVVLMVRGTYPRSLYDLILGLHRWVLRVAAYAALMTDVYPPFRLDTGGHDPGHAFTPTPAPIGAPPAFAPAPGATQRATGGTASVVGGVVLLVLGSGMLVSGLAAGGARLVLGDGPYLTSPAWTVSTPGYAVQLGEVSLHAPAAGVAWVQDLFGEVRLRAEAEGGGVFLGVAERQDVEQYLAGVQHTVLDGPGDLAQEQAGAAPTTAPTDSGIWAAQVVGTGRQEITVVPQAGDWVAVVMPADGGRGFDARIDVGATVPWLGSAVGAAVLVGLALVAGGAVLVERRTPTRAASLTPPAPTP